MRLKDLNLGDRVRWTSQAGGYAKTKEGAIIAVVPAHSNPRRHVPKDEPSAKEFGLSRNHESYIVKVGTRLYWPRVKGLEKVTR